MRTLVLLVAVLNACATLEMPQPITLGQAFTLSPGPGGASVAKLASDGWTLEFVRVASDSRCPVNVDCVWAGDAELELRATRGGNEQTFSLHTGLSPREQTVLGYRLVLQQLEPQPGQGIPTYRATFVLEKP